MPWDYKREEQKFEVLPEGKYRIRIKDAEKAVSKSGNDMLVLQFEVSGSTKILFHYIVFMDSNPAITNAKLTQFFDSFKGIEDGDFNLSNWIGKVGACKIKHDTYEGQEREKISYFIDADHQDDIPAWVEPNGGSGYNPYDGDKAGFKDIDSDDEIPF